MYILVFQFFNTSQELRLKVDFTFGSAMPVNLIELNFQLQKYKYFLTNQ